MRVVYVAQSIDSVNVQADNRGRPHGLVDGLFLREMAQKIRRGLAGQLERGFSTGATRYRLSSRPGDRPVRSARPVRTSGLTRKRLDECRRGLRQPRSAAERELERYRHRTERRAAKVCPALAERHGSSGPSVDFFGTSASRANRSGGRSGSIESLALGRKRLGTCLGPNGESVNGPILRIVSDELWQAVQARRRIVAVAPRQTGSTLMRGK